MSAASIWASFHLQNFWNDQVRNRAAWVLSLLHQASEAIYLPPERIFWCYSQWQPAYTEMLVAMPHIEYIKWILTALEQDFYFDVNKQEFDRVWRSDDLFGAIQESTRQIANLDSGKANVSRENWFLFKSVQGGCIKRPFGYLLINLKTTTQDNCTLRTNLLSSE